MRIEIKKYKGLFLTLVVVLLLLTIGLTYAYFSLGVRGNENATNMTAEMGTLHITYTDGSQIYVSDIEPGWTATKSVTVKNDGTLSAIYNFYYSNLLNEILGYNGSDTNSEMHIIATCNSSLNNPCSGISETSVPIKLSEVNNELIKENIFIEPGEIQTYTFTFTFIETNEVQDYNQGKIFYAQLNVGEEDISSNLNTCIDDIKMFDEDEDGYVDEIDGLKYIDIDEHTVEIYDYEGNATSLVLPTSINGKIVVKISENAFWWCVSLKSVTIPCTVTLIENYAFGNCTSLETINIDNPSLINKYVIDGTKILDEENAVNNLIIWNNILLDVINRSEITNLIIPEGVTSIGRYALSGGPFTSITLPNSLKTIGYETFYECYSLKNIVIPSSVTTIGDRAFANCFALESVTIPNSVTAIGNSAFVNCFALESITIPNSVTAIGNSAFEECQYLQNIYIDSSVLNSIGNDAFKYIANNSTIYVRNATIANLFTTDNYISDDTIISNNYNWMVPSI